ncbi:hypothetical protein AAFC00_003240 [Neodothiora populina]|uniref:ATP-NAD kinase n=1 Tax=Neodothiora populina TaxID=2781224 RepID=A0ABR3PAH4_9PEZI
MSTSRLEDPEDVLAGLTRMDSQDRRDSDGSDSEVQRALEVCFDNTNPSRRKSSFVSSQATRPVHKRTPTSCFVHALLEEKQGSGTATPNHQGLMQERPTDKASDTSSNREAQTQSRLLTKKQLSDMAYGIRELSKRLGHVRLRLKVKNVFLLTKVHDVHLVAITREITEWLLEQHGGQYTVWVEDTMKHNEAFDAPAIYKDDSSKKSRLRFWNDDLCRKRPHTFDIVVALGGDGTVLYASSLFQGVVPPVLSFALGSLGFLTKFDYNEYAPTLTRAFNEGITVSLRLRFEGTIMRSSRRTGHSDADHKKRDLVEELIGEEADDNRTHRPERTYNILNEVVLDRGPNPTMSSIEVFGDEEFFTTVQADGICVATPTGSTAYNLAAGGSLCHPDNPVILLTAICAHTLSFRPIILPDTIVLRIGVPYDARTSSWASFDGRERTELCPGDYVTISASRYPFPSILPLNRRSEDWIDSISRTLNWNSRSRQKSFNDGDGGKKG